MRASPSLWPAFTFAASEGLKVPGRFKRRGSVGLTGSAAEEPMLVRLHTLCRRTSASGARPRGGSARCRTPSRTTIILPPQPRSGDQGGEGNGEQDLERSRRGVMSSPAGSSCHYGGSSCGARPRDPTPCLLLPCGAPVKGPLGQVRA
eukprot:jgi/Mesvir1/13587/Mv02815-RA.1